eukprot:scaffold1752_cov188-Amphora_coffeaeformis.AAC.8
MKAATRVRENVSRVDDIHKGNTKRNHSHRHIVKFLTFIGGDNALETLVNSVPELIQAVYINEMLL